MVLIISIVLLFIWFYIGWIAVAFLKNEDAVLKGLLSPTIGMAIVIFIITSASLMGIPIKYSAYFVISLAIGLLYFIKFDIWKGFKSTLSINLMILLGNFFTVSIGLFLYGSNWQGFINGDAATNSLAAQYFTSNSFFSEPNIRTMNLGFDYSSLSAMLYVIEGHRFGDVMLLGFSATVSKLNPDQVYMAHALVIRCALIASSTALIYQTQTRLWSLLVTILLLSLSPLGIYTYLNQLISQLGGLALSLTAIHLISRILNHREYLIKLSLLVAIIVASLSRYYPESIPFLILSIIIYTLYIIFKNKIYYDYTVLKFGISIIAFTFLLINISIPMVVSHILRQMGSVGRNQDELDNIVLSDFGYAFQPDSLSLLYGFQALREQLHDPWATLFQIFAFVLTIKLVIFSIRNLHRYPLLISLSLAGLIMFSYLSIQESGFGAFKMMLHLQPMLFTLCAVLLNEAILVRNLAMIGIGIFLMFLAGRVAFYYVTISVKPHAYNFAQNRLLDKIQNLVSPFPQGAILYSPNFLFGEFAILRAKKQPIYFEQNFPEFFAQGEFLSRKTFIDALLPTGGTFPGNLKNYYNNYATTKFECGDFNKNVIFQNLIHSGEKQKIPYIIPGGKLIPLNRLNHDTDLFVYNKQQDNNVLMFQPSNLGEYYGVNNSPSIFNLEPDLFINDASIAGVGQFMLLEVLNFSENLLKFKISFTRTIFAGQATKLPKIISIYGEQPTELETTGSGALNLVTPPIYPCDIGGRKYVLVDFGVTPNYFDKNAAAPWIYQYLNVPYVPDLRKLSGFLRDISISLPEKNVHTVDLNGLRNKWNFDTFKQIFDFSGIYEDGWMSDQVMLQLNSAVNASKLIIEFEVPFVSNNSGLNISIYSDGNQIQKHFFKPSHSSIELDIHLLSKQKLKIITDVPGVLPNGDNRSVIGLISSIRFE